MERISGLNLKTRFNTLLNRSTTTASAEVTSFLASPLMLEGSDAAVRAAVTELEKAETVDSIAVMKVAERFREPGFGEGLARLEKSNEVFSGNTRVVENVTRSGLLPELDKLSRTLPEKEFKVLTDELIEAGASNDAEALEKVTRVIEEKSTAAGSSVRSGPVVTRPPASGLRVPGGITRG